MFSEKIPQISFDGLPSHNYLGNTLMALDDKFNKGLNQDIIRDYNIPKVKEQTKWAYKKAEVWNQKISSL